MPPVQSWFDSLRAPAAKAEGQLAHASLRVVERAELYRELYGSRADVQLDRVRTFIIMTTRVASDDGVLLPDGMDASEFDRRPVALWCHDDWQIPIGRWLNRRRITAPEDGWEADVEFAPAEVSEDADDVFRFLAWAGFGAASIRFRVVDGGSPTPEETILYSIPRYAWIGRKWLLKEISICNIPADPGCLMVAARSGDLAEKTAGRFARLLAKREDMATVPTVVTDPAAGQAKPEADVLAVLREQFTAQTKTLTLAFAAHTEEILAGFAAMAEELAGLKAGLQKEQPVESATEGADPAKSDGGDDDALYAKLLDSETLAALAKKVGV